MSADLRVTGPVATLASPPPPPRYLAALSAVYTGQLARAKVARGPLLFVATLQSVGIMVLLRTVVAGHGELTGRQVVAGATVLVVAFVALNLLAQRFGMLKAAGALDYYAVLPVPASAVVIGTAASYATFTVPGSVVTALIGVGLYGLPVAPLVLLVPVVVAAGAALAGLGAVLGLSMPRPELATVAGQLGMSAVVFLDLVPGGDLPWPVQVLRAAIPSTYAADAFAAAFEPHPRWWLVAGDLAVCVAVAVATLALAAVAFRRAARR